MRRSTIDRLIERGHETILRHGFRLPPFAHWTPAEFEARAADVQPLVEARRG
jgi:D-lyxose ketol-isomerase